MNREIPVERPWSAPAWSASPLSALLWTLLSGAALAFGCADRVVYCAVHVASVDDWFTRGVFSVVAP